MDLHKLVPTKVRSEHPEKIKILDNIETDKSKELDKI